MKQIKKQAVQVGRTVLLIISAISATALLTVAMIRHVNGLLLAALLFAICLTIWHCLKENTE